jgi:hypothetical protein
MLVFNEKIGAFTSVYKYGYNVQGALYYTNNTFMIDDGLNIHAMHNSPTGGAAETLTSAKVKFVVNENSPYTKVFDSQNMSGELDHLKKISYGSSFGQLSSILKSDIGMREETYMLSIPRETAGDYDERIKGKYLTVDMEFDGPFRLPYVNTSYRASMI